MAWTLLEDVVKAIAAYFMGRVWGMLLNEKCLVETCFRPIGKRGLCLVCYSRAKKKVEAGETSWEKLVDLGLCEVEDCPFDDAYTRAMEGH